MLCKWSKWRALEGKFLALHFDMLVWFLPVEWIHLASEKTQLECRFTKISWHSWLIIALSNSKPSHIVVPKILFTASTNGHTFLKYEWFNTMLTVEMAFYRHSCLLVTTTWPIYTWVSLIVNVANSEVGLLCASTLRSSFVSLAG